MTTAGQPAAGTDAVGGGRHDGAPDERPPGDFVLYDGACPVCHAYMGLARLRQLRPDVAVIDARRHPALVRALRAEGYDVDDSMIVRLSHPGRPPATYVGGDATRMIYDLASDSTATRRLALWVLGGAPWRRALYPYLRAVRNLLIRALGKGKIG